MKRIDSLLVIGTLSAILSAVPMTTKASDVLEVTYNSSSTINNSQYTGTLEDGTVLGFYRSGSYTYFCGAITSAAALVVPEKILYSDTEYEVNYFGRFSGENIDFDEAPNVTSLTLPSVLTYIYSYVPSSVSELHLLGTTPPRIYSSGYISSSTTVYVPKSAYGTYQNYCNNGNNGWNTYIDLKPEGWQPQSFTVTVSTAGTFGNVLLSMVEQWSDVDELTVIGHLNDDDLKILSRLKQMRKLDLSQTDITVMTGCSGLSQLQEVLLPSTVTEIGGSAFSSCSNLKEISAPNATSIGEYAFYYCSSLTTVSLPAATTIGSYAFGDCSSLTTVSLPAATQIGSGAFDGCSSLTTVSLPACLQSLGGRAFYGCSNLQDVYCRVIVPLATSAFSGVGSSATLHVPAFSLTSYMLSDGWYSFNKIVALDEDLTDITINDAFTITSYDGLADKANLDLTQSGHLTVSAGSTFNIGTFTQQQATTTGSQWNSSTQSYVYTGISTLIANNEIKADGVNLRLQVPTSRWNFISLPFDVNVSDIEYPEGTLWVIRKYSGADRAALTGNTWQNMSNGTILQAGEGYILHCASESASTVEFVFHPVNNAKKNNIFAYQDVVKPLSTYASEHAHNRSWNLVGNPYPAYFDTHCIEHNGVITVYQGSSGSYGSYTAYSLLDDDYVLRPNEAFFVQCPIDAASMTFKAEGRSHVYSNSNGNARRTDVSNSNRHVYNFTLTNGEFTDKARLVINPEAKMDYEISCDASKFMSDNQDVPQLYVYDNGVRYAIDERPLGDGIISLGTRFGQTGDYTIALTNNPAEGVSVILTDATTGTQVNLAEEAYAFTAQAGTTDGRFTLTICGGVVTGIQESSTLNAQLSTQYDLQGRQVNAQQQKGIYIVKQNGKSRKVLK